jgi:repressor LexA
VVGAEAVSKGPRGGALLFFCPFAFPLYIRRLLRVKQLLDKKGVFGYGGGVMAEGLHPRRVGILRFLARSASEGVSPTERDIGRAVGLRSSQTVHHHLLKLEDNGYVERGEARRTRSHRPVSLTEKGWEAVGTAPLMGRIAAGRGMAAVADGEAYSLAAELLSPKNGRWRYLLRVVGNSMIGAHIADGDLLVVEEDEDPPDGEAVVALVRGGEEVTVKRLYRERGGAGEALVRLKPQNGEHQEIVLPAEEVVVQGRVVSVIHPPRR